MSKQKKRLLVVIVNYKSANLVCQSLGKLIPQLDIHQDHVCIVDNDSQDNSVEMITQFILEHQLGDRVKLIASRKNGGFSYGNNLAIKSVLLDSAQTPEFFLLLNPDTLVREGAITELINFMMCHPQAGIAGSRLEKLDGTVQHSAFRFHTILSEIESSLRFSPISWYLSKWKVAPKIEDKAKRIDWVSGACLLIKYDVIKDVDLMDENYFLYFEETDFCLQAQRKGWECWYVPTSKVVHLVGQSTGIVDGNKECTRRPQYWFESRQYYFIKNHGVIYTMFADLSWGIGFAIWRLRRIIQNKPDTDPEHMLIDFWKHSIFFKHIFEKSRL